MAEPLDLDAVKRRHADLYRHGLTHDSRDVNALVAEVERLREANKKLEEAVREGVIGLARANMAMTEIIDPELRRGQEGARQLAASRAVFVALKVPALPLADAAKRFGYRPRTPEGDAFEHAFEWAHEECDRHDAK